MKQIPPEGERRSPCSMASLYVEEMATIDWLEEEAESEALLTESEES